MDESRPKVTVEKVRELINLNPDSHQYFFSMADERWLDWLWKNGLLAGIQKPIEPENPSRVPELGYLSRVAEKNPARVVDIMLEVSSVPDAFNPETLDQFLWICSKLPADQFARMVPKIHDENWVRLIAPFDDSGFRYENILKVLSDAKDYDSVLLLAETILSVRTKEDTQKSPNVRSSPFCLQHVEHTKVFDHLAQIDNAHLNRALALVSKILEEIILLGDEEEPDRAFKIEDKYPLYDVDFFTLERNQEYYDSPREQVQELAAVAKHLIDRLLSDKCQEQGFVREIYNLHIQSLPESRMGWHLQLYFLSVCPEVFKAEIKEQTFRIFACKMPSDITLGAEYQRFLQATYDTLGNSEQRSYIARIIESVTKKEWEYSARGILLCLVHFLTPEERELAEASFGPLKDDYTPQTAVGEMRSGWVEPQAPPETETEWRKSVPDIVNLLKTVWAPSALKEKYRKDEDFLRPIDAEGVAGKLKLEMKTRPAEFIQNAPLFFDRANLDSHYTYAFFQGIYDLLREKKMPETIDVFPILTLMKQVIASASAVRFEIEQPSEKKGWNWLAHWNAVHNSMADVARDLLSGENSAGIDFAGNRDSFYDVIKYLLADADPSPKDEELATAKITISSGNTSKKVADPLTLAINSVRGRAFQALVYLAYRDAELMDKYQPLKINADVKRLYEDTLRRENTRAIMFMFGHYLPSFYFRDRGWGRRLLFEIFPTAPEQQHLYLAAWEGYLANKLYQDMFFDPEIQKLYQRGIVLTEEEDPTRKQVKDTDEMLAAHLGLAFMYYEEFDFEHPLFKAFWAAITVQRHREFVDFLGRMFVSGQNPDANKLLETEPRTTERLKAFWDWALATYPDAALFNSFGFWMNLEKPIFNPKWLAEHTRKTLEKTRGFLDWDYVLVRSISQLAQSAPEDTLTIARLYLLESGIRANQQRRFAMHINREWLEAFRVLHNNPATKEGTYALVDDLIREGGSMFWGLKDILQ
jgi:hypothetical protein